jgi:hypothetical protein
MKCGFLFSIALLLSTLCVAFANAESSEAEVKKFSVTMGGMYTLLVNGSHLSELRGPGISLSLDYALDTRSSLFLNATAFGRVSDKFGSIGYKYWLADPAKFRPWVQLGAGYVWNRSTDSFQLTRNYDGARNSDVQFSFGGGLRYELTSSVGLDAAAVLYKAGAPWRWIGYTKVLATSLGADVRF